MEGLSRPLAQARARIESDRAEAELWFNEAIKGAKDRRHLDGALLEYVRRVFFSFAEHTYNAALEINRPVAELREALEGALSTIVEQTFHSKHYNRDTAGAHLFEAGFRNRTTDHIRASDEWRQVQQKLKELADWQAEHAEKTEGARPSLISRLPKKALMRMEAETARFIADYIPKLERGAGKGRLQEVELLREIVTHHYNLVARECMAVSDSVEEFESALHGEIAQFVHYGLGEYRWLADPMREELDQGFAFFIKQVNPWAQIPEEDHGKAWHVGAITGQALAHAALKLRAEAWKLAADRGFPESRGAGDFAVRETGAAAVPKMDSSVVIGIAGDTKAGARKAFMRPILREKGMTPSRWATKAGVDPSVVYDYLKGTSNPRPESRKVLAQAIGLKVSELPE